MSDSNASKFTASRNQTEGEGEVRLLRSSCCVANMQNFEQMQTGECSLFTPHSVSVTNNINQYSTNTASIVGMVEDNGSLKMFQTDNSLGDNIDWKQMVSRKQKRKSETDLTQTNDNISACKISAKSSRDPRLNRNNIESIVSPNSFELLSEMRDDAEPVIAETQNDTEKVRPPPIHLKTEINYLELKGLLSQVSGPESFSCKATSSGITIYPTNSSAYRSIVKYLRQKNALFYTYQLGEDKSLRVVLRGLHPSIEEEAIKNDLIAKGFKVRSVTNVLSRDKVKLPLFFVDLDPEKSSEEIFKVNSLFQLKIQVEHPRQKHQIVQCTRCQRYGHTKGYCTLPPRCVKCAGPHSSQQCTKSRETPAMCALCQGNHPASYRGCNIHKELQNRRSPVLSARLQKETPSPRVPEAGDFPPLQPSATSLPARNFTAGPRYNPHRQSSISYSQVTQSHENTHPQQTDLSNQISSFMSEMKSILTPLITLMSQLINVLLNNGK
jgi:hypothetical protein